jgi:phosphoglycolate phosphatase-like HAD superfamily hydrolase
MKPILIDLDGTILDVWERHHAVYSQIFSEFDRDPMRLDEFKRRRREGNSTPALLAEVLASAEAEQFSRRWLQRIESPEALALDVPYPGAVDALTQMGKDHDVILVTLRRERENLMSQLDSLGIRSLFRQIISLESEQARHKHELPRLERVAAGGYVVGDTEADIRFAIRTARDLICVSSGMRSEEFLTTGGAKLVVDSIDQVPQLLLAGVVTQVV